jgi:hypothetical protein
MIKKVPHLLALLAMTAGSGSAHASCAPATDYAVLTATQIGTLLVGSTACYPAGPPYENQEFLAGGNITDYKKGPSDPIDPSKVIGTYSLGGGPTGNITYSYTGGPSYLYSVWGPTTPGGTNYDLCVGTIPITVRIAAGSGPC